MPEGWSNDPGDLYVDIEFTGCQQDEAIVALKHDFGIPTLADIDRLFILDGGDQKYYTWDKLYDIVAEIHETDLEIILETLSANDDISSLKLRVLGELTYDPWESDKDLINEMLKERADGSATQ